MLKVLIVDGDPAIGGSLDAAVALGAEVTLVRAPGEALRRLFQDAFDVVLVDLDAGGHGRGRDLLAVIRQRWPWLRRHAMGREPHGTSPSFLVEPLSVAALTRVLAWKPAGHRADERREVPASGA
jgi:CheY-like chemotaxis protein